MIDRDFVQRALGERYNVGELIGEGGFATVWRARDTQLAREIAVKVLRPDLGAMARERFLREARAVAGIQHPAVISVFEIGEHQAIVWYTMPFVDGESLRALLTRQGRLPVDQVVHIVSVAADALGAAHAAGIVHRDVKPDNVLLERDTGRVFLVDFGIAAVATATSDRLTSGGLLVGTPRYMSPEQLSPGGEVDARSDIYSLGLTAYELLAGEPPFLGPNLAGLLVQQLTQAPPPLAARVPGLPPHLSQVIERCLEKAPEARWQTAAELSAALRSETAALEALGAGPSRRGGRSSFIDAAPVEPAATPPPYGLLAAAAAGVIMVAADVLKGETMFAPFGVVAFGLAASLWAAGRRRATLAAALPRKAQLMSRRAQSLRTSAASKITRLPHAWRELTSRVESLASMLAFEAAAAEEQLSALHAGSDTESRALHEARLLGALAELEALNAAVHRAAAGDDPEAGRRVMEEMVQARAVLSNATG
ncbi:MAG: serine/threonine-protein kinase [Gemmatimonadota bacterium]|nr:serine/threonine-protein kinase [Gemmatimonadota bacterium]